MYKKAFTPEQALQKLRHYCAYQERSHQEAREKLFQLGCSSRMHDEIISSLIQDNYLNEERFAIAYAGGKWRAKHWGRIRIKLELQQRKISAYCIRKALEQIEEEHYQKVLEAQALKKYSALKQHQYIIRKKKTIDYLVGRGFEPSLVRSIVSKF
ncbi:MAG: RecX family transcriptional regulator [Bacteroidetes bacterium]|nr:RecX family transcriptional regulator [Bacteroidota bacterium]